MANSFKLRKRHIIIITCIVVIVAVGYYSVFDKGAPVENKIGTMTATYTGHDGKVWMARFVPGDSLIASTGIDSTIRLFTVKGEHRSTIKLPTGIPCIDVSADGRHIVAGGYDETVRIIDMQSKTIARELRGHKGTVWITKFSNDGRFITSGGEDKLVRLWEAATGTLLKTFSGHTMNVWALAFSKDGSQLVSSGFDNSIRVWDVASGKQVRQLPGHTEAVVSLAFNEAGNILASGSDDGTIRLWDFPNGKLLKELSGDLHHVYGLAFQPGNGSVLLSGHLDKGMIGEVFQNFFGDTEYAPGITARLWNIQTGKLIQTFSGHGNDVNDVDWSSDGKYFVTASEDNTAQVWRVKPGKNTYQYLECGIHLVSQ